MDGLAGRVVAVTGASKGMGRHFVTARVGAGMRVACLARPSDELDTLTEEFGDAVLALPCDVSSSEAVDAAIACTAEHFGRIDTVIANGAIRSEEHTSELQSLMRISYAVFCLKKKNVNIHHTYSCSQMVTTPAT